MSEFEFCRFVPGQRCGSWDACQRTGCFQYASLPNYGSELEWDKDKVIAAVRADLLQRSEFGLKKYGRPISDRQDISFLGWVNHMYEELLDAANYAKSIMMYETGFYRLIRQKLLFGHGKAGFGEEYFTVEQRAIRLFEEACECAQAAGVSEEKARELIGYSYSREPGELAIEIGQVGVTLAMLAEAAGLDVEGEERAEADRFLAKPVEAMQARLREKLAGGMPVAEYRCPHGHAESNECPVCCH